jgi:alkanesulfonate monooxygenase SsuD/methylene tetrahydromethanopterin reductase-like flavin-dependent oxidoreductase (luciferase family)
MKFGIALTPHWSGKTSQSYVLDQMISRIEMAEKLGYFSAWTTEHHFANDPDYLPFNWEGARFRAYDLAPDPLTLLTFAAARTKNIRLGTGVLLVNYENPIRLAEKAAMLDVLSGGRLELGIGRGGQMPHVDVFQLPHGDEEGQIRYREALEIMMLAWSGQRFEYRGKYFNFDKLEVVPHPIQRPIVPLYTSTQNIDNFKEAARMGLSHVSVTGAWGESGIDAYNEKHQAFAEAAREVGRDPDAMLYPVHLFMYCAETDAEAEDMAEEYMLNFTAHVEAHYMRQRNGGFLLSSSELTGAEANLEEIKAMNRKAASTNLIGSPKTVREKLAAFLERVPSVNYVHGITDAGSPPPAFVEKSMKLFAEEVAPAFADFRTAAEPADA